MARKKTDNGQLQLIDSAPKAPHGKKQPDQPGTSAQQLGSLVKSARDIMRKDKGLNGDLDRLPMLTWVMFLKFLDDLEQSREQAAPLGGEKFRPAIDAPYRWRDWAARRTHLQKVRLILM